MVGLLTSDQIPLGRIVHFGIISDGIHTHPAALRIAHKTHPEGLVLVTDAISALGLEEGIHKLGQFEIEIRKGSAYIAGTDTLCGSMAEMPKCVRYFKEATGKFRVKKKQILLFAFLLHYVCALMYIPTRSFK